MAYQTLIESARKGILQALSELGFPDTAFVVAPAKAGFGDLSCNVSFMLAKRLGRAPADISSEISRKYESYADEAVPRAEAHPSGYLNLFFDWAKVCRMVVRQSVGDGYGRPDLGGGRLAIEHTSVNPNKALHIGHVRNIVIGDSLSRIMRAAGFDVSTLNYIDDSGLQVADILLGFAELGFSEDPPDGKKFDHYCGDDVYVKAARMCEEDPELAKRRDLILREIEDGTSGTAGTADRITGRVLCAQLETCWRLGASYDCLNFESQIIRSGMWEEAFGRLKEMGLAELESEGKNSGCWVIRGQDGEDDKVVVRSNGTATYMAKDIPYAAWKLGMLDDPFGYEEYAGEQPDGRKLWQTTLSGGAMPGPGFFGDRVITVIDSRQSRLQRMITSLMARFKSDGGAYVHLGYESVTLSPETAGTLGLETQGKSAQMSGRRGLYVSADRVLDILYERVRGETGRRNPGLDENTVHEIARAVSVATIRYEMVKQDLDKMITFDITRSLSLEGDTAPYIQYGYVRATRLLEKAGRRPDYDGADYGLLRCEHELRLVGLIGMFEMRVRDAAANMAPKVVARYCHELAVAFNGFYEHVRILDSGDGGLINARICLVGSFMSTMQKALDLIGISAPPRM